MPVIRNSVRAFIVALLPLALLHAALMANCVAVGEDHPRG